MSGIVVTEWTSSNELCTKRSLGTSIAAWDLQTEAILTSYIFQGAVVLLHFTVGLLAKFVF